MKKKNRKIKLSNVLILLGVIIISLNVFFIVIIEPILMSMKIEDIWNIDAKEIKANNQRIFESSDIQLEVLDTSEIKIDLNNQKVVGFISIPNVDLSLPILRGATSENLDISATTILENQVMGEGNYPIAGHRTIHPDTLFSPLSRVRKEDEIYLTDKDKIFIYKVESIRIVDPETIEVLDITENKVVTTLITCFGKKSEFRRVVVGVLIKTVEFSESDFEEYFKQ